MIVNAHQLWLAPFPSLLRLARYMGVVRDSEEFSDGVRGRYVLLSRIFDAMY